MNGKIINLTSDDLSRGGILTPAAAQIATTASGNLGNGTLSIHTFKQVLQASGDTRPSINHTFSVAQSGKTPLAVVGHSMDYQEWGFKRSYLSGDNCILGIYCDKQYWSTSNKINVWVWILYMNN